MKNRREDPRNELERARQKENADSSSSNQRPDGGRTGMEELHARADRHQIRGDVERVGDDEGDQ